MKQMLLILIYFSLIFCFSKIYSQSPTDLNSDVDLTPCGSPCTNFPPSGFFSSVAQIETAFNYARRQEELQLGLAVNSLGDLILPPDYISLTAAERGLVIINDEREVRGGLIYGGQAVLGLPLQAIEDNLNVIAENHTIDMVNNNFFSHIGSDGQNPFERIDNSDTYGTNGACRDFLSYSENLYSSCGGSNSFLVAQAMFSSLYRDAGSNWGHRRAILIQNFDVYGATGYLDNYGEMGTEGFLGIGTGQRGPGEGDSFGYCPSGLPAYVLTMNIVDPSDDPACDYEFSLPVELVLFDYEVIDCEQIKFTWATSWELNHSHFILQSGNDGENWIIEIDISNNDYSRNGINHYSTVINSSSSGAYFRLIQEDYDGTKSILRNIRVVNQCDHFKVGIFPNPAKKIVNISGLTNQGKEEYIIYNVNGMRVKEGFLLENNLNISTLPDGVYLLSIGGEMMKLIVNR